jgi:hypothetical protein
MKAIRPPVGEVTRRTADADPAWLEPTSAQRHAALVDSCLERGVFDPGVFGLVTRVGEAVVEGSDAVGAVAHEARHAARRPSEPRRGATPPGNVGTVTWPLWAPPGAFAPGSSRCREQPAVTLGPAACAAPSGAAPQATLGRRRLLGAASRHALARAPVQASFLPRPLAGGLGRRPRRTSDRLPPSFGRTGRTVTSVNHALQPGPREAAPPFAHPVSPTGAGIRRAFCA